MKFIKVKRRGKSCNPSLFEFPPGLAAGGLSFKEELKLRRSMLVPNRYIPYLAFLLKAVLMEIQLVLTFDYNPGIKLFSYSMESHTQTFLKGDNDDLKVKAVFKEKKVVNHDSYLFTFTFDPEKVLGVPVGNHLRIFGYDEKGEKTRHSYTPISDPATKGHVEILIKVYRPCPEFPKGGAITQQLEKLKEGETVEMIGPCGKTEYKGRGVFSIGGTAKTFKKFSYLAGGSGITPFLAIMRKIASDPEDKTEVTLLFSNKTGEDILMHDELMSYLTEGKLKYEYTLTREKNDVEVAHKGRITEEMVKSVLPAPADDHLVFFSGPKGFNATATVILEKLGHSDNNAFKY